MFDNTADSSDETLKKRAKKMWIIGLFLLPFVWLVMPCYFKKFWKRSSPHMRDVRWYVIAACIGFAVEFSLLIIWMIIYLTQWESWGATGDKLNVITVKG